MGGSRNPTGPASRPLSTNEFIMMNAKTFSRAILEERIRNIRAKMEARDFAVRPMEIQREPAEIQDLRRERTNCYLKYGNAAEARVKAIEAQMAEIKSRATPTRRFPLQQENSDREIQLESALFRRDFGENWTEVEILLNESRVHVGQ